MIWLEPCCMAIVLLYVVVRVRTDAHKWHVLGTLALLVVGSWLAENTVIHAYGFYKYTDVWSVFVDRVPLMIILIWPVVIHSAWDLARCLHTNHKATIPVTAGVLVLADASLIEPIAVQSGLWHWTQPGLFEVPPIGIVGWAFFATASIGVFERFKRPAARCWAIVFAPVVTHALLLLTWWGALRWVNHTVPPAPVIAALWALSMGLAFWTLRRRTSQRIPLSLMLTRLPAAVFFFVLLGLFGPNETALWGYAVAFAPPWMALVDLSALRAGKGEIPREANTTATRLTDDEC